MSRSTTSAASCPVLVGSAILAINFLPVPAGVLASACRHRDRGGVAFVFRQRRAASPLYDLKIAGRRVFWVAACAGIIVFGSLMGAMFIGQQFLQNVLAYSTLDAGAAIIPAALAMVIVAPRSAKLVEARGARFTLLLGYVFSCSGFVTMFLLWNEGIDYWPVALGYALLGHRGRLRRDAGVALPHRLRAGQPRRHGLGHGRPPARPRRRVHAVDLRRAADRRLRRRGRERAGQRPERRPDHQQRPGAADQVVLERGAVAAQYPQYAVRSPRAPRRRSWPAADWAYLAGIVAVLIGATLVFFMFPRKADEERLLEEYHAEDTGGAQPAPAPTARHRASRPEPDQRGTTMDLDAGPTSTSATSRSST